MLVEAVGEGIVARRAGMRAQGKCRGGASAENPYCVAWYNSQIGKADVLPSGVILAVALEAEPVPIALVAVTMQVYAVSLVRPLIVMGESVLVPV